MTQEQIETLLTQLQQQVQLNTTAIQQLSNQFNNYVTLSTYYSTNNTVNTNQSAISTLQQQVATLQTSIGLVNKVSKLIDVNITNVTKDDLLQWDGDRWTNIKPSKLGITGGTGGSSTRLQVRLMVRLQYGVIVLVNGLIKQQKQEVVLVVEKEDWMYLQCGKHQLLILANRLILVI